MYTTFIFGFSLLVFILEFYIDLRQYLKYGKTPTVPSDLQHAISDEKYQESRKYGQAKLRFGMFSSVIDFIHDSWLIFYFGALPWLWELTGQLIVTYFDVVDKTEWEFTRSWMFVMIWTLYRLVFNLPFSLYRTFVLEEKFGFNKQTIGLFFVDMIKEILLTIIIGTPIMYGTLFIIRSTGPFFWLYAWLFVMTIMFVMMMIYPEFIAPLFNKYTELPEGELRTAVFELAEKQGFPLKKLFVVDGSTRSAHSNAYLYGFGSNKRIVLYDTLLKQVDTKGIVAILAHELGHWKFSHTLKGMLITATHLLIFFYLFGTVLTDDVYQSFGMSSAYVRFGGFQYDRPVIIGLILFSWLIGPIEHFLGIGMNALTRSFEFQSDRYAAELGYELGDPLIKIHVENLGNVAPDWLYSTYHASHPPLLERLRAIRNVKPKSQ